MESGMKRINSWQFALLAVAVGFAASGCGNGYLRQSRDNFHMVHTPTINQSQVLNPDAGKNRKVVAGLDGAAAANVGVAYSKSFSKEQASQGRAALSFIGLQGIGGDN